MRTATARAIAPESDSVDHRIHVIAGREVVTRVMKAGETVQFYSTDGRIKIRFDGRWPFTKTKKEILGSKVVRRGQLSTSEEFTLAPGRWKTKFECFIKPFRGPRYLKWDKGGEIKPRGK